MSELTQKDGSGLIPGHFDPLQVLNPSAIACTGDLLTAYRSLFDPFCDIQIGELDLPLGWAGFGELLPLVGAVQVPQQPSHLCRDLKSSVFLGNNLYINIDGKGVVGVGVIADSSQKIIFVPIPNCMSLKSP